MSPDERVEMLLKLPGGTPSWLRPRSVKSVPENWVTPLVRPMLPRLSVKVWVTPAVAVGRPVSNLIVMGSPATTEAEATGAVVPPLVTAPNPLSVPSGLKFTTADPRLTFGAPTSVAESVQDAGGVATAPAA